MDLSILKIGMLGFYSSVIFIGQSDITKSKGSHTVEGETTEKICVESILLYWSPEKSFNGYFFAF